MPPNTVLWAREPHTAAKHAILLRYLQAWIPIMATQAREICLIDGFAGPGLYLGGEDGSPMIMLNAFHQHRDRQVILGHTRIRWLFVEKDRERYEHLDELVQGARSQIPAHYAIDVVHGDFGEVTGPIIPTLGQAAIPTFLFIDPFGFKDTRPELSAAILGYRRCEVLIFLPVYHLARFVTEDGVSELFDNLFGSDVWRGARELASIPERKAFLHDRFVERLRQSARFVRSFEVETGPTSGYHLFFATNNVRGLEKMKEAMWAVDPEAGSKWRDATAPGQEVLFEEAADLRVLERQLRGKWPPGTWFNIDDAVTFTIEETSYLVRHLKSETLVPLEQRGQIDVINRGGRHDVYPSGTLIAFRG